MLEEARPDFPLRYPGRDTAGALAAGALAAVIGAARQLVDEARRALGAAGASAPLVATGGDAAAILEAAGETLGPRRHDPRLLERGLARLEAGA
ncbi:MAG: hypothetical protein R3F20_18135 [Planctomycetota bacterium]